jgi:CheY-like chemotaxis protein
MDMKLLLVDDNEKITEVISFYCSSINVDCMVVNDGKEGVEIIRKNNDFELILLDLAMPDFSGVNVVNSLKEDGLLDSRNVVIINDSSDHKMLEEIRKSGVKGILRKPCSLDELTEVIDKFRNRN